MAWSTRNDNGDFRGSNMDMAQEKPSQWRYMSVMVFQIIGNLQNCAQQFIEINHKTHENHTSLNIYVWDLPMTFSWIKTSSDG